MSRKSSKLRVYIISFTLSLGVAFYPIKSMAVAEWVWPLVGVGSCVLGMVACVFTQTQMCARNDPDGQSACCDCWDGCCSNPLCLDNPPSNLPLSSPSKRKSVQKGKTIDDKDGTSLKSVQRLSHNKNVSPHSSSHLIDAQGEKDPLIRQIVKPNVKRGTKFDSSIFDDTIGRD